MSGDEKYVLIENYLKGNFSEGEKRSFEKLLVDDSELAKKYSLYKLADELVIENRLLSVKNILLEERKNRGGNNVVRKIIPSIIVLALSSFLYFTFGNKKNSTDAVSSIDQKKIISSQISSNKNETINQSNKKETSLGNAENTALSTTPINQIVEEGKEYDKIENIPLVVKKQEELLESTTTPSLINENKKALENSCSSIIIDANFSTIASCKDESNGSISFRDIKGGNAPYSINIKNKENEDVSSLNIPAGYYSAVINDKRGCIKTINAIVVPEKNCEKEYTFNPFMEEVLILPSQNEHTTLSIYERSGNLYFTKENEPAEEIQWNGYSKNGELITGYFIFVLTNKNGKEVRGGITIVR